MKVHKRVNTDLESSSKGSPGGDAHQQALLRMKPSCHGQGLLTVHLHHAVQQLHVQNFRDEAGSHALNQVATRFASCK